MIAKQAVLAPPRGRGLSQWQTEEGGRIMVYNSVTFPIYCSYPVVPEFIQLVSYPEALAQSTRRTSCRAPISAYP